MMNLADFRTVDELRLVTSYDIVPYVITEKRLFFALEKYYGIKHELRYISLTDPFNPETSTEETDSIESIKASFEKGE